MLKPSDYASMVENYAAAMSTITSRLIAFSVQLWMGMPKEDFYDDDLVLARAARSATGSEAANKVLRTQTLMFHKRVLDKMDAPVTDFPKILGGAAELISGEPTRNVNPLDMWTRPAEQYRYHKSLGLTNDAAMAESLQRIEQLANTSSTLTARHAARDILGASKKVTGYRRVIHPELTRTGTCGLCAAASTRIYQKEELLPIHTHCVCTVAPVIAGQDPGFQLNEDDLAQLYDLAGGTFAEQLSRVKYEVKEHGELGPVLVTAGRRIAPPRARTQEASQEEELDEVPAKKLSMKQMYRLQAEALEISIDNLRSRASRGEDVSEPLKWQRDRLALLRKRLGR